LVCFSLVITNECHVQHTAVVRH